MSLEGFNIAFMKGTNMKSLEKCYVDIEAQNTYILLIAPRLIMLLTIVLEYLKILI